VFTVVFEHVQSVSYVDAVILSAAGFGRRCFNFCIEFC